MSGICKCTLVVEHMCMCRPCADSSPVLTMSLFGGIGRMLSLCGGMCGGWHYVCVPCHRLDLYSLVSSGFPVLGPSSVLMP